MDVAHSPYSECRRGANPGAELAISSCLYQAFLLRCGQESLNLRVYVCSTYLPARAAANCLNTSCKSPHASRWSGPCHAQT